MKAKLFGNALLMLVVSILFFSCQKSIDVMSDSESKSGAAAKQPSGCNYTCADYQVGLVTDYTLPGKSVFTWTITNPCPGNGKNGSIQDLSHWNFVPSSCLDNNWQDVLEAWVNTGSGWIQILPLPSIGQDPSLKVFGCYSDDVFKFDYGTSGSTPTQYRLVLAGHWNTGPLMTYFKSGANTGCCSATFTGKGIGCREDEDCSFSQGYWFANNTAHPNGVHPWGTTVTVGGYVYTNAEGLAIWNASNVGGIRDAKKAFTQLAAVRLSGIDETNPALLSAIATIEGWLGSIAKLSPAFLPNQSAAEKLLYGNAKDAAGLISAWINTNHCGG